MTEWLDLMLEEVARKRREAEEARDEIKRRKENAEDDATTDTESSDQSK